jgi:hypothetical protein
MLSVFILSVLIGAIITEKSLTSTTTLTSMMLERKKIANQEALFKDYLQGKVKSDSTLKLKGGPIYWEG